MEENREEGIIIGGDFNIRIGKEGEIEELDELRRSSKDKVISNEGKRMVKWINEIGGYLLNGTTKGHKEGEFTYVEARGSSIIHYGIVNEVDNSRVRTFKIDSRVDSDHMLLIVIIDSEEEREEGGGKKGQDKERAKRTIIK